jgi:hypothetical protein
MMSHRLSMICLAILLTLCWLQPNQREISAQDVGGASLFRQAKPPIKQAEVSPVCQDWVPSENVLYHIQPPLLCQFSCCFASLKNCEAFALAKELLYRSSLYNDYDLSCGTILPSEFYFVRVYRFDDRYFQHPLVLYVDPVGANVWLHYDNSKR